jgi:hypothetical protein
LALHGLQGEIFSGAASSVNADKISEAIFPAATEDYSKQNNYFASPPPPAPKAPEIPMDASGLTVEEATRWQVPPQQTLTTPFWMDPSGEIPADKKE